MHYTNIQVPDFAGYPNLSFKGPSENQDWKLTLLLPLSRISQQSHSCSNFCCQFVLIYSLEKINPQPRTHEKTKQPPGQRELRPIGSWVRAPVEVHRTEGSLLNSSKTTGPTSTYPELNQTKKKKNLRILTQTHIHLPTNTPTKTEERPKIES